ncbi:anhydro-N-acetylmuramic acid kinase [Segetibacter sp. 3557_3]|uniref:anhydro-N-acetylmuramic acid kinase n=1 Tax=Segetibacter sp. 3557_3 TaxID=2547429 RepID=UPI0010584B0B|nr:anhydro-N-acetylmuramic acid kinase [Segetibacter sp. 3557_3]TDH25553.1 anhydro-N-acetylmuramic acid kinase [Segetibacter sp. 3557_3]
MTYRVIGIMSGSSLDGLDIAFIEFNESGGKWAYEILHAACLPYSDEWVQKLASATSLSAYEYLLLHAAYGKYIGERVNEFIGQYALEHRVQLISSHGHTTFHAPELGMTAQLGDGAAIAAATQINVVSDLRALDVAFGGQGAPIVPIGEKLLLPEYDFYLNLGGIANIAYMTEAGYVAYDICPANRVLNMIIEKEGQKFDEGGRLAASGNIDHGLLSRLKAFAYYDKPYPKSLANDFGTTEIFPLIESTKRAPADALRTYVEHIAMQVVSSIQKDTNLPAGPGKLLVTGGGGFNHFLIQRLSQLLSAINIEVVLPDEMLINYKEALVMGLIGVLRWREEYNVISTVTGAKRASIGGAVWIGQEG